MKDVKGDHGSHRQRPLSVAAVAPRAGMHIGLATTTLEPSLTHGHLDGIGVYSKALLEHLPATGCTVAGYSFPRLRATAEQRNVGLTAGQRLPHSFAAQTLKDLLAPRTARTALPVDLYHATDYRIVRMACPVVATLHDAIMLKYPQWCSPRARRLKNVVLRHAAGKADHVIALSAFAVTELVQYFGIDERRISVVPCGVARHWLQRPAAAAIAGMLRDHALEAGYFLFVGTLQPRKNIDRILDAYLSLPPAVRRAHQCVIVGRPGWRCEQTIARLQALMAAGERVVWLRAVEDETQLRQIYAAAGVFVFPSLHEGFGMPLTEAFASCVPVVTANTTSLPEVAQGAALEVDPLDVAAIAAAMLALVREPALRQRCIAAGLVRATALSWSNTAQMTAAVYHKVLAG